MSAAGLTRMLLCGVLLLGMAMETRAEDDEEGFDPVHHTANGYYLDFSPIGKVELPRLFVVRTESGGYKLLGYWTTKAALRSHALVPGYEEADEGEVHDVEALVASGHHLDARLVPVSGSLVIDLSITRHLMFAFLAAGLLLWAFIAMARRYARGIGRTSAPRGLLQNTLELFIVYVRDDIAIPCMGMTHYRQFLPFLLTVFFFVITCNLLGLVPWGATASSNIMMPREKMSVR